MNAADTVVAVIDIIASSLQLGERGRSLTSESRLLGAIPEFDSMAVVVVVTSLEERFGFAVDDDEIDLRIRGARAEIGRSQLTPRTIPAGLPGLGQGGGKRRGIRHCRSGVCCLRPAGLCPDGRCGSESGAG